MEKKETKVLAKFSNLTQFNSQFSKAKIYIAYHGDNRNYTSISKDVFEDMIPSLYGIPVVGEWIENVDSEDGGGYGSHGGKIEISDKGVKYIETTKPIGFVGQDAETSWETVTEEDGQEHEYLVASPVYLWTGRYPEAQSIIENENSQSMEIQVFDGDYRDDEYFDIKKGEFSALCVLGNVEPCFEQSAFKEFSKDEFKAEFNLMVKELKESLLTDVEGGGNVKDEKSKEFKVEETAEEMVADEIVVDEVDETIEETTVETKAEETTEKVTEEVNEEIEEEAEPTTEESTEETSVEETVEEEFVAEEQEETKKDFELSTWDLRDAIGNILNPIDANGNRTYDFWVMDVFQTYVIVADESKSNTYYKVEFAISEDDKVSVGEKVQIFLEWLTQEQKDSLDAEKSAFEVLKSEVEALKEFKANIQAQEQSDDIEEVFEKFATLLKEEDYADLKDGALEMGVDVLEKELSFRLVQKKFDFSKVVKKDKTKVQIKEVNTEVLPYGTASVYFNK